MANYSYVKTGVDAAENEYNIPIDESVSGIIFDIGGVSAKDNVLSNGTLKHNFSSNTVQKINNLSEAVSLGITSGVLNGVPYYHIKEFYKYYGGSKELYVMFADIYGSDVADSPFEEMMLQSEGNVFQVGVWTSNAVLTTDADGKIIFNDYLRNINAQLKMLNGTDDSPSGYPSGINAVVSGGLWIDNSPTREVDYRDLPDCTGVGAERVSLLIGEDSSSAVRNMRKGTVKNVGLTGIATACMSLCYAEESIAYVDKFNLNKSDSFAGINIVVGGEEVSIDKINEVQTTVLCQKGYVFPLKCEAREGGLYFSSESTMTDDNFRRISFLRLKHKIKRIMKRALLPQVNGPILLDKNTKKLSDSSITVLNNSLTEALDTYLVNPLSQEQVSTYRISIDNEQDELEQDILKIDISYVTLENQETIDFTESFDTK